MTIRSWIRRLFTRTRPTVRKAPARFRPRLEALEDRLTPAYPAFTPLTGAASPFNGLNVLSFSRPALGDVDGDGAPDLVVGSSDGTLHYFLNTGSATSPVYSEQTGPYDPRTGAGNPFNGINVGVNSAPALGDLDGDGDLDLVVGAQNGTLHYFRNTGSATNPAYVEQTGPYDPQTGAGNPFNGIDVGVYSVPALGDVDGDGGLDLVVGNVDGTLHYFRNTGSATGPAYAE